MYKTISLFLTFFCLTLFSLSAQDIIYVDVNSTDPEMGNSWNNPYHTLQEAIDKANEGDHIWVAMGKYNPTTKDRNGNNGSGADLTFFINKDITILGGFERGDDLDDRDPENKVTTLLGKNTGFNHYQVVNIHSCSAVIDGFTISDGLANGASSDLQGGAGIYIYTNGKNITPRIEQCIIKDNRSDEDGGAVYITDNNNGGTIDFSFVDCIFTNNTSLDKGGALYVNATFQSDELVMLDNCTFENNESEDSGGAAYLAPDYAGQGDPIYKIRDCQFTNNHHATTATSSSYAGAIYMTTNGSPLAPLLEECLFSNNSSVGSGGAMYLQSSSGGALTPTFSRCRFDSNTTDNSAGAVAVNASTEPCNPIFVNCIFFDSFGDTSAGAISVGSTFSGTVDADFYYCDFVSNYCDLFGAVFRILNANSGGTLDVAITNSIFFNNTNGSTPRDINLGNANGITNTAVLRKSLTDRSNCTNTGATECNNIDFNADPLFFSTATGDLRIPENSPAHKNAEDLSDNGPLFQVDYAGMPRPKIDPDIGAYQYDENALSVEWIAVTATQKAADVIVNWETVNERAIAFYQIEHSHNGRDFQKIGNVAANNNASLNSYHFKHQPTAMGKQFYRIVQVTPDGTTDISKIISIDYLKKIPIYVYPNPVSNSLQIGGHFSRNSILQFVDYKGVIRKQVLCCSSSIPVTDLPTGLYLIRLTDGTWQQQIIIKD